MKTKLIKGLTAIVFAAILVPAILLGAKKDDNKPNPYKRADESWISISGTAVAPGDDSFTLDYGKGLVNVEMDDWDWYAEGKNTIDGDKVTVYGRIDDDLFETTSIEASSVYVESLGSYFYASAADEEGNDDPDYWIVGTPVVIGNLTLRGTVTSVNNREFTIDTGTRKMTVDTIAMGYNPMDDKGYQQIDKGDFVSVAGSLENDVWEKRELMADTIIVLEDD